MRKRTLSWVLPVFLVGGLGGVGALSSLARQEVFPHQRHARLFPDCQACHADVFSGDPYSIAPENCATCHDGEIQPEVAWSGPRERPTNLTFTHEGHPELDCATCHEPEEGEGPMRVERAVLSRCLVCHAPDAEGHRAEGSPCETCHVPLTEASELPGERVAGFTPPPDHGREDFLSLHGAEARADVGRCSVCHARESCLRCHVNGDRLEPVRSLAPDSRVASLVAEREGEWPEPASHAVEGWAFEHGEEARAAIETCANCHTRESCQTCHGAETAPAAVGRLPGRSPGGPAGVALSVPRPPGHTPGFETEHGTAAASGQLECGACHRETFCVDCHDRPSRPSFHPVDFVARHGAEAFAEMVECSECHSNEVFCRDCHTQVGIAQSGARRAGAVTTFHDAQPDWLLVHGQAARQDLEACASCHQQSTCLRCHSAKSGWRVSPHGPGLDLDRVAEKSTMACGICHFDIPGGAGAPPE